MRDLLQHGGGAGGPSGASPSMMGMNTGTGGGAAHQHLRGGANRGSTSSPRDDVHQPPSMQTLGFHHIAKVVPASGMMKLSKIAEEQEDVEENYEERVAVPEGEMRSRSGYQQEHGTPDADYFAQLNQEHLELPLPFAHQ
ncbi:unnamed protein product, partial [Amoebophrya sp. A25]|eukprot:GSA25T00010379001.1